MKVSFAGAALLVATMLGAATALAVAVGSTPDHPLPGQGKRPPITQKNDEEMLDAIQRSRSQVAQDPAFLEPFNNGSRDPFALLGVEFTADGSEVEDFDGMDGMIARSAEVILVTTLSVRYKPSPIFGTSTVATYRVLASVKGSMAPGEVFEKEWPGGPFRQPSGAELFVKMPSDTADRLGQQLFLSLETASAADGTTYLKMAGAGGKFALAGGRASASPGAKGLGVEGLPEAELLARARSAAGRDR